jgi:hypothetical protein
MNPIIGFTGVIMTFLAFYIQYKANLTQKELFEKGLLENEKKILDEKVNAELQTVANHKVNIKIFCALINSMLEYYASTGDYKINFIKSERANPLKTNIFNFTTNASYKNFQKLDFVQLYNSIVFHFTDSNENWEIEFIQVLNYLDFYQNMISELKEKYTKHVKKKYDIFELIGNKLDEQMHNILLDDELKNLPVITEYLRIILNKDPLLNDINKPPKDGVDFEELRNKFFVPFIKDLLRLFTINDNHNYKNILESFSQMNKKLGSEKLQSEHFADNLEIKYNKYFIQNNEYFNTIKNFKKKLEKK